VQILNYLFKNYNFVKSIKLLQPRIA